LLLAPSRISGWGLFTKYALKKGDFVHSYVGELVSQEEAERRGQVDDIKNRSYLFNLS
jgi:histone-lysine N-methyltransferase EZH2